MLRGLATHAIGEGKTRSKKLLICDFSFSISNHKDAKALKHE
jgi:hypothetical protein